MGQTLEHGIFLPDEGERNCYSGLAENWVALDTLVGAYSSHYQNTTIHVTSADKQAWNEHVADTVKHVTASDKQAWNEHVADTVKHVTASDKQAWNEHVADTDKHVTASDKQTWNGKQDALSQTQLDAVNSGIDSSKVQQIATNTSDISSLQSGKANDSDVVHKSGNETIGGDKTFSRDIKCFGDSDAKSIIFKTPLATYGSTNTVGDNTRIEFLDKNNKSISYIRQRKLTSGSTDLSLNISNTDSNNQPIEATLNFVLDSANEPRLYPGVNDTISIGRPTFRYKSIYATNVLTYKINSVEPSSLSLPSQTYVDISSYFTNTGTGEYNTYTAPSNGWIFLRLGGISSCQARVLDSSDNILWGTSSSGSVEMITIPILSGCKLQTQWATGSAVTVATARFIPCQGNV